MTISEVSKQYGVSADTLRYYERIGLIPPVPRINGARNYDASSLSWVELVKCMRSAGVGIEALMEYARLFQQGGRPWRPGRPFWWNSGGRCWRGWRTCSGPWSG